MSDIPDIPELTGNEKNQTQLMSDNHLTESDPGSDSDTDSTSDSDTDTTPPKLKYTRLNKLPSNFFTKDPISTCCITDTHFIFATHSGLIHICDTNFTPIRTFKAHRASILSIYTDGTYFATGSMDGTVVIGSMSDETDIVAYNFSRPIHAVILDRNYTTTRSFITGGMSGKIILSTTRNWIGKKRQDVVLQEGYGPIVGIKRIDDDLIMWMNDNGINIYNLTNRQMVVVVDKPKDSPRSDLYWPRVTFPDLNRVIIAWSNYIWCLKITNISRDSDTSTSPSNISKILPSSMSFISHAPEKQVDIEHVFKLDCLISGITSFTQDSYMILTYEPPTQTDTTLHFNNPELKLINSTTGSIEFEQELGLRDVDNLGLNDFTLDSTHGENTRYFIISAKDAVIAQELQLDDQLDWYLLQSDYLQAWEISEHLVTPLKRMNFGIQYVDNLIKLNEWVEAGKYLVKFLQGGDKEEIIKQWEIWGNIYINSGHIVEFTDIVPPDILSPDIYNRILEYWMVSDTDRFYNLVSTWDTDTFDVATIQTKLESIVRENDQLRPALILLYDKSLQPIKAVPHKMHLQDDDIIPYLSKNHILTNFINELPEIIQIKFPNNQLTTLSIQEIQLRTDDIITILVEQRLEINPKSIMSIFTSLPLIQYFYLEKLDEIDNYQAQQFNNDRINLYCQFKRDSLLPFLHRAQGYDIDQAITTCQENQYYPELVYLLGKIGQNKQAIELITTKLNDPYMAIQFANSQNDQDTWNYLVDYSMSGHINFIKALIEQATTTKFYDPITILKKMPPDLQVPELNESIIEFSNNNELNLILDQIILRIIYHQSKEISTEYKLNRLRGREVELEDKLVQSFETVVISGEIHLERELTSGDNSSYTNHKKKLTHLKELEGKLL
ncbi:Vacuolar protein sorting-associated protein 41 [Spathaspora sp. JA1]|nr:Vacuolar protein sorting-associated protein 41 [Spathaspora sp. JA1]